MGTVNRRQFRTDGTAAAGAATRETSALGRARVDAAQPNILVIIVQEFELYDHTTGRGRMEPNLAGNSPLPNTLSDLLTNTVIPQEASAPTPG
ncbi:hypothetical protein ACWEO2_16415 [Nocardia sp. NPDC004278]